MIFFNIPSVGQIKPETTFGSDDHFGFIQTLLGFSYNRKFVRKECQEYYEKENERYWDQIITLINFLALKKLDEQNRFVPIPLLRDVSEKYDNGNRKSAEVLFEYILCQWQHPHPILTQDRVSTMVDIEVDNQRTGFAMVKPYKVILSVLQLLEEKDEGNGYLSEDEFYWLGYYHYETKGIGLLDDELSNLSEKIIELRQNGGWSKFSEINNSSVHLSYPKGMLNNSTVLTTDSDDYHGVKNFFVGLKPNAKNRLEKSILAANSCFEFERSISFRDRELYFNYSEYLYSFESIRTWLSLIGYYGSYDHNFNVLQPSEEFDSDAYEKLRIVTQLKRLSVLERTTITRRRTEQQYLRKYLFRGNHTGECGFCDKELPVKLLETAHIKKRSHCSDDEKRDPNVVMPACHLGCNKLYEESMIKVTTNGFIQVNDSGRSSADLKLFTNSLQGKPCSYHNNETAKYFDYHFRQNN